MWSDTYDRELTDIFTIQDEIAGAILEQLKAQLLGDEQLAVAAPRANSEAYDLYLLAKQRIYERTRPTLEAAAETLDRAIAIDPELRTRIRPARHYRLAAGGEAIRQPCRRTRHRPRPSSTSTRRCGWTRQQPEALAGLGLYYSNIPGRHGGSHQAPGASARHQSQPDQCQQLAAERVCETPAGWPNRCRYLKQMLEKDPLISSRHRQSESDVCGSGGIGQSQGHGRTHPAVHAKRSVPVPDRSGYPLCPGSCRQRGCC